MFTALSVLSALLLFLLGLRLSAFFSGCETGFYRVSFVRLSIDAHSGDRVAERLLWYTRNPGYFVATTLVGNNVANYVTTLAIGLAAVTLAEAAAGWIEIVATLAVSPIVFISGELLPKNLYYRSPLRFLRRDVRWFDLFFRLFFVVSFPLIWITKALERLAGTKPRPIDLVLGRSRLAQVLSRGHKEGLLTEVQNQMVNGLMEIAVQPLGNSVIPLGRILGVAHDASREEFLECARRYGLTNVTVRRADSSDDWYGYVRVVDLAVTRRPPSALIRPIPRVSADSRKLEALLTLREAGAAYCAVERDGEIVGIASARGLVEQLFRSPAGLAAGARGVR